MLLLQLLAQPATISVGIVVDDDAAVKCYCYLLPSLSVSCFQFAQCAVGIAH